MRSELRKRTLIYRRALERWPEEILPEERAFQRGWIKGRSDCWKAEDARACVETSYRTRMVKLQIQSGQLEVPSPVGCVCQGEERHPFMVVFISETDPPPVYEGRGRPHTGRRPEASCRLKKRNNCRSRSFREWSHVRKP